MPFEAIYGSREYGMLRKRGFWVYGTRLVDSVLASRDKTSSPVTCVLVSISDFPISSSVIQAIHIDRKNLLQANFTVLTVRY